MPKLRLGVVLLIPPPVDREINALRRATGDGTYGRVPAHITLVPPVNVNEDRFGDVLRVLREAAAATRPFTVHLGAPATFLPANPVLYLPLAGHGRADVFDLRDRVFHDPLARPLTWPFVPHVTLADEARPDRIAAAEVALADYGAELALDRVHLLRESAGRVWQPVADAAFGPPAVVGRGGLPLELTASASLDPEARAFAECECRLQRRADGLGESDPDEPNLALVARRDGEIVGTGEGRTGGGVARVATLIVGHDVRRHGIGSHLLAAFESAAAERGCRRLSASALAGSGADAFYRARGWVEEARLSRWYGDHALVHLRRDLGT